jgi:hypothetical protein
MLAIDDPNRPLARDLLTRPGGFAWWYADLRDDAGSGLVLIWSFGLPFLPGYAAAERAGQPELPASRPSLNLAVYDRGALAFYQLTELAPDEARWDAAASRWTFGRTEIVTETRDDGRRALRVSLDCDVPASHERLTGTIEIVGTAARGFQSRVAPVPAGGAPHVWTPLIAPARGTARLEVGGRTLLAMSGRAYHDRNGGAVALHRLGMRHWLWGRVAFEGEERIYFACFPRDRAQAPLVVAIALREDGTHEELVGARAVRGGPRLARFGMPWWSRLAITRSDGTPWLEVDSESPIDDGPFYLRTPLVATTGEGARGRGFGELCRPDRVDRALERPFVRMRVHRPAGDNSVFLPLFTGRREDRVARLVTQFRGEALRLAGGVP